MNIKNFFDVNLKKIVVTLVLVVLLVPFLSIDNGVRCIKAPCNSHSTVSVLFYLFEELTRGSYLYNIFYLNLFLGVVVSYFVSCLVAYFTFKLRKYNHK